MCKIKSTLKCLMLMVAIGGLIFVIGCGASQEQQKISQFLMEYGKTVDEYSTADNSHKAEIAEKVDSYKAQWKHMKMELGGELTPQALDKLDNQYQAITKKYTDLAGKS